MKLHCLASIVRSFTRSFLLLGVLSLAVVPAAKAQLSFTISPVSGHSDQYTLTVGAGGFNVFGADQSAGSLTTDSAFISGNVSGPSITGSIVASSSQGLTEPDLTQMLISGSTFSMQFASNLQGGGTNHEMSGSATFAFGSGNYSNLTPGTYNFISGAGAFSHSSNYGGTLTVQAAAVPEPSTYAAILGLVGLGFVIWRRRGARVVRNPA